MQIYWLINEHNCEKKNVVVVCDNCHSIFWSYMQCDLENIATNQVRQLFTGAHSASRPMTQNNVIMTSKRSRSDVAITLLLHRVPVRQAYMASLNCPACRTTFIATRFRVAVICPIIPVPHCIRVFFYFVWFVFINHIFQFYYELCTYCNILDIYLS